MPYVAFHKFFPEIAEQETRAVTVFDNSPWNLPAAHYSLFEMYCDEPGCDCRRVFFSVVSSLSEEIEAVIAYGWETLEFYAKWMGDDDPEMITELKGPVLNLASPQSRLAPEILKVVSTVVLADAVYVERLKRHYRLFRERIEQKERQTKAEKKRKRTSMKKNRSKAKVIRLPTKHPTSQIPSDHFTDDYDEFESWEPMVAFRDKRDYPGLVKYCKQRAEKFPEDAYSQSYLGEAYVLNGEYEKAIQFLSRHHRKQPYNTDFQYVILDALFALGKNEDDFQWNEKPTIVRMSTDILDRCYEFLKPKRKPRSIVDLYIQFVEQGYLLFKEKDLFNALMKDTRFVVDSTDSFLFAEVRVVRKRARRNKQSTYVKHDNNA